MGLSSHFLLLTSNIASTTTYFFLQTEPILVFAIGIPAAFWILGLVINIFYIGPHRRARESRDLEALSAIEPFTHGGDAGTRAAAHHEIDEIEEELEEDFGYSPHDF
jgi:hypothetical protein